MGKVIKTTINSPLDNLGNLPYAFPRPSWETRIYCKEPWIC